MLSYQPRTEEIMSSRAGGETMNQKTRRHYKTLAYPMTGLGQNVKKREKKTCSVRHHRRYDTVNNNVYCIARRSHRWQDCSMGQVDLATSGANHLSSRRWCVIILRRSGGTYFVAPACTPRKYLGLVLTVTHRPIGSYRLTYSSQLHKGC